MKNASITLAFLLTMLLGFAFEFSARGDDAAYAHVCTTPEELKQAASQMLSPPHFEHPSGPYVSGAISQAQEDGWRAWIIDYLDNPDPRLQRTAAYIIANAYYAFDASRFTKFLDVKYPIEVQASALIQVLANKNGGRSWDDVQGQCKPWVTKLLNLPVAPPYFTKLAEAIRGYNGILEPGEAEKFMRLMLSCGTAGELPPTFLQEWATTLPRDLVFRQTSAWYQLDPRPEARRFIFEHPFFDEYHQPASVYDPVLNLGKADWDEFNSAIAADYQNRDRIWEREKDESAKAASVDTLFQAATNPATAPGSDSAERWDTFLKCLNAREYGVRLRAAQLLASTKAQPTTRMLDPYMDASHFLPGRMAALAASIRATTQPADREARKAQWSKLLNEALTGTCSPPFLQEVLTAASWTIGDDNWVSKDNRQLTIRRLLWLLPWANDEQTKHLLSLLKDCDADMVAKEIVDWYGIEPDETVRRKVLEYPPVEGGNYKPLLDLAKRDWDEKNRSIAQKALDKLNPATTQGGP